MSAKHSESDFVLRYDLLFEFLNHYIVGVPKVNATAIIVAASVVAIASDLSGSGSSHHMRNRS
jgi:Mg2+/citrate symporter